MINLRNIDLNLLVVLCAIHDEKSVGKASIRLGMTRSAVSHSLRRLRMTFSDQLFDRTPEGMVPTAQAINLIKSVQESLSRIQEVITAQSIFEPAQSEREFRILISDFLLPYVAPGIVRSAFNEAPSVKLTFQHYPYHIPIDDVSASVDHIVAFSFERSGKRFKRSRLFSDRLVLLMSPDHPARYADIAAEQFKNLKHLRLSSGFFSENSIDRLLGRRGFSYNAAVTVPSLSGVIPLIRDTDLVLLLPGRWAESLADFGGLKIRELTFLSIELEIDLCWRAERHRDSGVRWLKRVIERDLMCDGFAGRRM